MGARITAEKCFVAYYLEHRVECRLFLVKINCLADWRPFEYCLAKHLKQGLAAK